MADDHSGDGSPDLAQGIALSDIAEAASWSAMSAMSKCF
jgi:hypothetical protein